jgi:hypothetical protein
MQSAYRHKYTIFTTMTIHTIDATLRNDRMFRLTPIAH